MKFVVIILSIFFLPLSIYSQVNVKAKVVPGGNIQFVNKQTNTGSNNLLWKEAEAFVNGFAKVYSGSFWTLLDGNGNPINTVEYEAVRNFKANLAAVKHNKKWGFLKLNGQTAIPYEFDIIFDFDEVVTAGQKNNKWFLIDKNGTILKELDIDVFFGFKNHVANIKKNGSYGKMNLDGEIIYLNKALSENSNSSKITSQVQARPSSAPCPTNIGFELGNFTNWECFIGTTNASGTTNVVTVAPSPPTITRHEIYASAPTIDPYGLFSTTPPDGSGFALKLGNDINGSKAERVSYQIVVPAGVTDASITYRYAVVFQDPGHFTYQQPRFSAKLLDVATNTYLPCASYEYISDSTLPGFFNSPVDDSIKCKDWASVFINLSAYAGRTLNLEFTTADCTRGAHWGYAYVDVGDCNIAANIAYQCSPSVATVSAPPGFQFYNWWNSNYTSILATGQNPTISPIPANNSSLHVEIIPFNGYGCRDTLDVLINNSYAVANAGLDKNYCTGDSTTLGAPALVGNTYSWSPATFLSNANISSPTATPPVTTTYYLTVTNPATNCPKIDTVNVIVSPKPIPDFTQPQNQCLSGNTFTFNNSSTGAVAYLWQFGDGTTSTLQNPSHIYTTAANYSVKLIVTGSGGCMDSLNRNLTVFAKPTPAFSAPANQCITNNNFTFNNTSTGASAYLWQFGDGTISTLQNPSHSYTTAANYTVKLIVTNSSGCKDSLSRNLTVFAKPTPAFAAPANQCISNNNFTFNNASTGATNYLWHFGDGSISTLANPTHSYTSAANYTVKLIVTNSSGCKDSVSRALTVFTKPTPNFAAPAGQCISNNSFSFNNTSVGASSYLWQFGDGTTSVTQNPSHTYTTPGNYNVKLIVTNISGCKDSLIRSLTVFAKPTPAFAAPANQCISNNNFTFFNTSSGASSYLWQFGDGTISTLQNPSHSYTTAANYSVKLIVTNSSGCKDSLSRNVTVFSKPTPAFITPANQCISNNNFLFNNTSSGATTYLWQFGDSTISNLQNPSHTYSTAGNYIVKLIVYNTTGCKDSLSKSVAVYSKPSAAFAAPPNQCITNNNFTFTNASSGANSYVWSFGDGSTSTLQNPSHTYATAAYYTVKLIVTNATGCTDSLSRGLTVFAQPTPAFAAPSNQCLAYNNFTFNNLSTGAASFLWLFGDGNTSTLQNPSHSYTTAGNYSVKLIVTNSNGCKDSLSRSLTVFDKPTPAFTAPANQCISGNNFVFNNTSSGAATFLWHFGDGTSSTLQNPSHIYTAASNYLVKLIVTNANGCVDSISKNLSVLAAPSASFIPPSDQCLANNSFTFNNNSLGSSLYNWHFGDGNTSNTINPIHHYNAAGSYTVKLYVTNSSGCSDSASHTLNVNLAPTLTVQNNFNVCAGSTVQLSASGAQTYQWYPTQGLSCSTCPNPTLIATSNITYTVNAGSNPGCNSSGNVDIVVFQPIQIIVDTIKPICKKSSVNLIASGANSYVWSPSQGLNNALIANPIATPATSTNYMVIGKDAYNCSVDTGYVRVNVLPLPTVQLGPDVTLATGTLFPLIAHTGNSNVVSWTWSPATNLSCSKCQSPVATIKYDITYQVLVKNIFGCTAIDLINIHTLCEGSQVFVPNAFTPDGDGKNDILMVRSKGVNAIRSFKVFSRWGELIFEKQNFPPNNPSFGWDGKIKGKSGSAEVYVYILDVTCDNNEKLTFKGNISILN